MDTSAVQAAQAAIQQNTVEISTTKAKLTRAQETIATATAHKARVEELRAQRSQITAQAFIDEQTPDTADIDEELKRLERTGKAEALNLEAATGATELIEQRLTALGAKRDQLVNARDRAAYEALKGEMSACEQEVNAAIESLSDAVFRCAAAARLLRQFDEANNGSDYSIERFAKKLKIGSAVGAQSEVYFGSYGNKAVLSHYDALFSELEAVGAVVRPAPRGPTYAQRRMAEMEEASRAKNERNRRESTVIHAFGDPNAPPEGEPRTIRLNLDPGMVQEG
ncbi:hypothetical protein [Paraburkholderia sp. MM5384-R2]|uniref:hypothetical protein n=1 Tax=unclassified Paraburkholderia TaxID=2615204 RepID=UPI00160A9B54|nr:hypothetical protein [Paraburkholderia sp. MM5384-R2]MBB5501559.1 hypothetical protein [Paraburkholderia sp. MM5384-R2]